MKKTYISPETIVVRLMPTNIIANSLLTTPDDELVPSGQAGGVKEDNSGSKNIWDEEW